MHLRIDKAAKEQVIKQLASERKDFMKEMNDMSFQLGQATAKLEMLEAPRPEPEARHVQTPDETVATQPEVPPSAQPVPPEPKKEGFFKRILG
jgi:hypothetical protein